MFVLEESQHLEDTITNDQVRGLYGNLKSFEEGGELSKLLSIISTNNISLKFTQLLFKLEHTKSMINVTCDQRKLELTPEEKQFILDELALSKDDASILALTISAALLELFVIDNYTGPIRNDKILDESEPSENTDVYEQLKREIKFSALTVDSSEVHHKIVSPWLLKLAHIYWLYINSACPSRKLIHLEFLVRKHRLWTIHLALLLEPVESMMVELRKIEEYIFDHHILKGEEYNSQLLKFNTVALCTELIQSSILRGAITFSRKFLDFVTDHSKIKVQLDGQLGRRTRFQTKDIPQLITKVNEEDVESLTRPKENSKDSLPIDVKLDDDTLLPDILFLANKQIENQDQLSVESQLILLSDLEITMNSDVTEPSLKDESILAYVRTLLRHSTIWSLKYKALAIRSKTEKIHHRRIDRALRQLEALIDNSSIKCIDVNKPTLRQEWFYSVLPLSRWQMQRLLGDVSYDLGLFKNALDIYEKIEYWEGVIKCLCGLGRTTKAEEIIREELAKNESPYLYCLLGDVTENIEYYQKSWDLSKKRFARAKKCLGTHFYVRKDLKTAVEHYEEAHKSSPSNCSILAMLAYCHLDLENYDKAAEHYRNLTYLDDANFLAWNNLTKAYVNLDQKHRAWRTIREAIKCNYEEWKVWDNLLMLSLDVGELNDCIVAWNRLIDLKSSHKDDARLNKLTHEILQKTINTKTGEKVETMLLKDALELLGRLVSTTETSTRIWICYFKLLMRQHQSIVDKQKGIDKSPYNTSVAKITNTLQRATPKIVILEMDWLHKPDELTRMFSCYDELLDCYEFAFQVLGPSNELLNRWKSFKLSLNNTIKTIKKRLELDANVC